MGALAGAMPVLYGASSLPRQVTEVDPTTRSSLLDVAGAIGGGQPGLQLRQGVARSRSTDVVAAQLPDAVVGVGQQFAGENGALTKTKPPIAPARCTATGIDALFPSRLPQVRGGAFLPALPC